MEPLFILFLIFFVAPTLLKAFRKSTSSAKPKLSPNTLEARLKTAHQKGTASWNRQEFQDLKRNLQGMSAAGSKPFQGQQSTQGKAQRKTEYEVRQRRRKAEAAKRSKRLKAHDASHGNTVETRDIHDRNRHRRADWGARAGPGILNTKTFITVVVMGLILAILTAQT